MKIIQLYFFPILEKKNLLLQDFCWKNNIKFLDDPRPIELFLAQNDFLLPRRNFICLFKCLG